MSTWKHYPWTPEQRVALSGLGPPWRVALKATRLTSCPTCKSPPQVPCVDRLHVDRVLACAAYLRATSTDRMGRPIFPPPAWPDDPIADHVREFRRAEEFPLATAALVHGSPALSAAAYCGRVRLGMDGGRWMWILTRAGVEAWCGPAIVLA